MAEQEAVARLDQQKHQLLRSRKSFITLHAETQKVMSECADNVRTELRTFSEELEQRLNGVATLCLWKGIAFLAATLALSLYGLLGEFPWQPSMVALVFIAIMLLRLFGEQRSAARARMHNSSQDAWKEAYLQTFHPNRFVKLERIAPFALAIALAFANLL